MGVKNENCTFEHPAKLVQADLERDENLGGTQDPPKAENAVQGVRLLHPFRWLEYEIAKTRDEEDERQGDW